MKIENININDIKPYENNPRNNDTAVEKVAESIRLFGFKNPVILDKNNVIVCGHARVKAAEKLGIKTIPCIYADDLTDEQTKAFRLIDNKTAEYAQWDFEKLELEIKEFNLTGMTDGFDFKFCDTSYIDDLLNNDFIETSSEKEQFQMTFIFDMTQKTAFDSYLLTYGKEHLRKAIEQLVIRGPDNA